MLLVEVPWAQRVWALPFLTALAPSQRYNQEQGHRHKTLTDWGRQMMQKLRRWLPQRKLFVVADSSFAALEHKSGSESDDEPSPYNYKVALGCRIVQTQRNPEQPSRWDAPDLKEPDCLT